MYVTCLISRTRNAPSKGARIEIRPNGLCIDRPGKGRRVLGLDDITGATLGEITLKEGRRRTRTWSVVTVHHHDTVGSGMHLLWFTDPAIAAAAHSLLDQRLWTRPRPGQPGSKIGDPTDP